MTLINPFVSSHLFLYQIRWAVEREFKNPDCRPYSTKPLGELTEPKYQDSEGNKGCYHIYNYRKHNNPTKVPYTPDDLDRDFKLQVVGHIFTLCGLGMVAAIVISVLVYFLGAVVARVIRGFGNQP